MKFLFYRTGLAGVLFVVSATVGILWQRQAGASPATFNSLLSLSIPGAAAALFLASAVFVPAMAGERLRFPLNVTLPFVHVALIFVVAQLILTGEASIVSQPEAMAPILAWTRPSLLVSSLVAEAAVLTLLAAFPSKATR